MATNLKSLNRELERDAHNLTRTKGSRTSMIKILNVAYFMQMQSNTSQPTTPEELRLSFPDNGINVK